MEGEHAHVCLELVVGSDPIRGRVDAPDGTTTAFHGWLELATLLEQERLRGMGKDAAGRESQKSRARP
jgi:hypothetical protein